MRFLCLVHFDPAIIETLPPGAWAQLGQQSAAYDVALQAEGKYVIAEALMPTETARNVQMRDGQMLVSDGPASALPEPLAGFILIEAADMEEALAIGAKIPLASIGTVEVRQVMTF